MATPRPYSLLAVSGLSPQVLTETVYELAHESTPMLPEAVHVVTTGQGMRFVDSVLHGKERVYRGRAIDPCGPGWMSLSEALGADLPAVQVHTPHRSGESEPINDVRTGADAVLLADRLYSLMYDLTQPGRPPVVASIAGGRKTMSADLQSAFIVYARPEDRLVHVLVEPLTYERRDFLFPTSETPDARLTLVETPVPRLRRVIDPVLLEKLPENRRGLSSILEHLRLVNYRRQPVRAEVLPGTRARGGSTLRLLSEDETETLCEVQLSASEAAILVAVGDLLMQETGPVSAVRLCEGDDGERTHDRRVAFADMAGGQQPRSRWNETRDVSGGIHRLNEALESTPQALEALGIGSDPGDAQGAPVRYRWNSDLLRSLDIRLTRGNAAWAEMSGADFSGIDVIAPRR